MGSIGASAAPPSTAQQSPWQSPIPYLFGGLAAMLGLIAFALLILACSYWKLSGSLGEGERDLESGEADDGGAKPSPPVMEEKYLVIMAGQVNATFLATPMSSRASSFGSTSLCSTSSNGSSTMSSDEDYKEKNKIGNSGHTESENAETHEADADQVQ